MTLYGIDISNNNGPGIDMTAVKAEGFDFVFAKVSEGDYFQDRTWPHYRDAATAAGLLVVGYHYVIDGCDPDAQAATFAGNGGGDFAMFDHEANSGGIGTFWNVVRAFNARGIAVVLSYLPQWYAGQIGSPDLSQVPGLIASNYVTGWGYASTIYPGDDSYRWNPYGGAKPQILQFTDRALVAGSWVDANAFRGSRSELAALLTGRSQGDDDMTPEQAQQLADIREQLCGQGAGQTGYPGWPQLGNHTPVDAIGELVTAVGSLTTVVGELQSEVAALKGDRP